MSTVPWRVAVLEDDAGTRRYFEQCVRDHPGLELAAAFGTLSDAQAWFSSHSADVLLTDLGLPDGHGLSLIRALRTSHPDCEILVISVFGDAETVVDCVEAGAVGYLHKDSAPEDVAQVILDVRRGASPISPMIARKLLERLRAPAAVAPAAEVTLTAAESEVLELIARGYAYAEIARLRGVSIHTVQTHVKHLYSKLAVHSRSEAVYEATQLGLLGPLRTP
jgi:DNA-binding NarL/FixJ family response regulator